MRNRAICISSVLRMGAVVMAAFVCSTQFLFAQEMDIVSIRNGDRITGEIKKFDRGRLEFKIEHMGTVNIEWDVIDSIQSRDLYDIELKSGEHYFGSLEVSGEVGKLKINT